MKSTIITFLDSKKSYKLSGKDLENFRVMSIGLEDRIKVEELD